MRRSLVNYWNALLILTMNEVFIYDTVKHTCLEIWIAKNYFFPNPICCGLARLQKTHLCWWLGKAKRLAKMAYHGLQSNLKKASARWSRGRPAVARPVNCVKVAGILLGVCLCTYVIVNSRLQTLRAITPRAFITGSIVSQPICRLPVLPVNSPDIMGHMKYVPPFKCTDQSHEEDWVEVKGSTAEVTEKIKGLHKDVKCEFAGKELI